MPCACWKHTLTRSGGMVRTSGLGSLQRLLQDVHRLAVPACFSYKERRLAL